MGKKMSFRIHTQSRSHVTGLLALTLLVALFLGNLVWGQRKVAAASSLQAPQAPSAVSSELLRYYLTKNTYNGANASNACTTGYHMASMWEIIDTSNLKYNPILGFTTVDSGQGPPNVAGAYVHTGYFSSAGSGDSTGSANCNAWTSESMWDWGTYVSLSYQWNNPETISIWKAYRGSCINSLRVWCVADTKIFNIHLPQVVR